MKLFSIVLEENERQWMSQIINLSQKWESIQVWDIYASSSASKWVLVLAIYWSKSLSNCSLFGLKLRFFWMFCFPELFRALKFRLSWNQLFCPVFAWFWPRFWGPTLLLGLNAVTFVDVLKAWVRRKGVLLRPLRRTPTMTPIFWELSLPFGFRFRFKFRLRFRFGFRFRFRLGFRFGFRLTFELKFIRFIRVLVWFLLTFKAFDWLLNWLLNFLNPSLCLTERLVPLFWLALVLSAAKTEGLFAIWRASLLFFCDPCLNWRRFALFWTDLLETNELFCRFIWFCCLKSWNLSFKDILCDDFRAILTKSCVAINCGPNPN